MLNPTHQGHCAAAKAYREIPYGLHFILAAEYFRCNCRHCRRQKLANPYVAGQGSSRFDLFCPFHHPFSFAVLLSPASSVLVSSLCQSCFLGLVSLPFHICLMPKKLQSRLPPQPVSSRRALLVFPMSSLVCLSSTVLIVVSFHHSVCDFLYFGMSASNCLLASSDLSSDCIPK